jgi:hypothetical protein
VTKRRKFEEHVPLFAEYAARAAKLSPEAWGRLRLSCAELNGPEFRALREREFEEAASERTPPPRRTKSSGKARIDAWVDANFALEAAVAQHERSDPGVATAVRAAGQAVLRHDWMSPEAFHAVYRYVESEIPYAELDPPATPPPDRGPLQTD